ARLNRPTLNLFLYDLAENKKLRQAQPIWDVERHPDGTATQKRKPVRLDLRYMITAWAAEPEDEHRILTRTLMALLRFPHLPAELLPESLQNQPVPIPMIIAQEEDLSNPSDMWSAMDNEWRPTITCIITLGLNPYQELTVPLVRIRELRTGQTATLPAWTELTEGSQRLFYTIGGRLRSDRPLNGLRLTLLERGLNVPLAVEAITPTEGRFAIGNLQAGKYTLEVSGPDRPPQRYPITVPSADYDFEV
ncbi:MAG: Pvc16 family protein, partial [Chloroflexota bacterium]